jgi:hypothetical protein
MAKKKKASSTPAKGKATTAQAEPIKAKAKEAEKEAVTKEEVTGDAPNDTGSNLSLHFSFRPALPLSPLPALLFFSFFHYHLPRYLFPPPTLPTFPSPFHLSMYPRPRRPSLVHAEEMTSVESDGIYFRDGMHNWPSSILKNVL